MGKGGLKADESAWERGSRLIRPAATDHRRGADMAAEINPQGSNDPNFPAHARNYDGFLTLLKYTIVVVAVIAAVVLYVISH
jgi:hypothetical protein